MKDMLPKKIWKNETAIINLDNATGEGTHWVCYKKLVDAVYYFDSIGNLPPPQELMDYFNKSKATILYNYNRLQREKNSYICGHLCLNFLATSVSML